MGTKKGCELISKINAEFVELIRKSGGFNDKRYLLLAGYWTDIDRTCTAEYTLPEDDRIMVSVHYYSPADFAIADAATSWGYRKTWGTDADVNYLRGQFEKLKTWFVDKGIPVIIGEYGCPVENKELESVRLFLTSVCKEAYERGICPVLWSTSGGHYDRNTYQMMDEVLAEFYKNIAK